ncbi:MAG TPA: ABC transporter substrate-binding protein [Polyangiaceae bacterium]|nr:ABC transporter substrate-binding protein [Polyangiaceae bacterium]
MPNVERSVWSRILRAGRSSPSIAAIALLLAGCSTPDEPSSEGIELGLLLPFTGADSATSSNFERAVLFALRGVNAGGGIGGRPLRVVSADTHSDPARARSSLDQLVDAGVSVVIGPESADIAAQIAPELASRGVAFLSPLVGAAEDANVDCSVPWFRLAPSAKTLGDALAKQLSAEAIQRVAILYEPRAYEQAMRSAVGNRFKALGGTVALEQELDPQAQGYGSAVLSAIQADVQAVVLATSPRTAALVVNDYRASSPVLPRWFLSPLLKTELLLANVPPEVLEGAIGVAPKIYERSREFVAEFAHYWEGDEPLEGAYFYYDAVGLLALALQRTALNHDGQIELKNLDSAVLQTATTRGVSVGWNEIASGLARVADGGNTYYSGLTGPLLLDSCGPRTLGASTVWRIEGGVIVESE